MSLFEDEHRKKIGPVLDVLDRVGRAIKHHAGVDLPAIVVIGDQSAGKTSVLESLSGVNLPRGQGIVTRVPLTLQLRSGSDLDIQLSYTLEAADGKEPYEEKIDRLEDVGEAVQRATRALAGNSKSVVDNPIYLRIRKPGAPDLTVIDLPGITRVAVADQPHDIEEIVKFLINKYIEGASKIVDKHASMQLLEALIGLMRSIEVEVPTRSAP